MRVVMLQVGNRHQCPDDARTYEYRLGFSETQRLLPNGEEIGQRKYDQTSDARPITGEIGYLDFFLPGEKR
jgi:hypothetical protein